jgi:hypothetical protein
MAKAQKQVIVESLPALAAVQPLVIPAAIRPIGADILPEPKPSPARELQQRLQQSTADLRLAHPATPSKELRLFILSAVLLWGGVLGGIVGLMVLVR